MNEPKECLICQQSKDQHDDIVCDAIRSVINRRMERAAKEGK